MEVGGNILFELAGKGEFWLAQQASEFFLAYYPWMVLGLLALAELTLRARDDWYDHQARAAFSLFKPAKNLRPEDLGFQVLKAGEQPSPHYRPFYEFTCIARKCVPYDRIAEKAPHPVYTEDQCCPN
jgi:hypothetical protein